MDTQFNKDLDYSNRQGIEEEWLERHKKYLGDKALVQLSTSRTSNENDRGRDMVVYSPKHNKTIAIEWKEHFNLNYLDNIIHIEFKHIDKSGKESPGWIEDNSKETDLLAYHKHSTGKTYHVGWQDLRQAWWCIASAGMEHIRYPQAKVWNGWGWTITYQVPFDHIEELIEWSKG